MNNKRLILESSICSEGGECCFDCSYLGPNGCTNLEFRMNSRCISFPVIYGNPTMMGHKDLLSIEDEVHITKKETIKQKEKWFILLFTRCKLLQDEHLNLCLRQSLRLLNEGKATFYCCSIEGKSLTLFLQ